MRSSSPDLCDGDGGSSKRLPEKEIESSLEARGGGGSSCGVFFGWGGRRLGLVPETMESSVPETMEAECRDSCRERERIEERERCKGSRHQRGRGRVEMRAQNTGGC